MNYQLVKQVRENNPLRKASLTLPLRLLTCLLKSGISKVTGPMPISPMLLSNAIKVIANASANIIDLRWQGEPRRYIQIGTVMTEPDHRNKGLAGQLIHHILQDWQQEADAFFYSPIPPRWILPQIWLHPQRRVSIYYAGLPASR